MIPSVMSQDAQSLYSQGTEYTSDQNHDPSGENGPEDRYRDLLNQVNDIVFRMTIEGVITEVSPSVRAILHYSPEEVIGRNITSFIPPRSMTTIRQEIAKKIADPASRSLYEVPIRARTGKIVICEINSRLIRRNGAPPEILGIIRDTTDRRKMESALRTSEKKYREIFENAVEGMFRTNPEGKILDANQSFAQILGYSSPQELIREVKTISSVYHNPQDREEIIRTLRRDQVIGNASLQFVDRGKVSRWIRLNARLVWEGDQEIIEGSCMDCTNEYLLEKNLREKEQVYRLLADNITDVIWTADLEMKISYMSPSVYRLRGYTPKEASIQPLDEVYVPESLKTLMESRRIGLEQLEKGDPSGYLPQYLELGMYHRDGHVIWTETVISLIFDTIRQPVGVVGSIRDISARKQVEKAHRESEDRLREAQRLAQVGNFEMNDRTRIIICSDEVCRILEAKPSSTPPTYDTIFRNIHPEDREAVDQAFRKAELTNKPFEIVFRILFPDNRIRHVNMRAGHEITTDGLSGRFVGTIQDISSRMILEEERNRLMGQIQRNIAELSILNDGIRNPLSIIETILEMEPEWGHQEISAQIARIDAMVTQLDRRWVESEKIFSYLQKHYGMNR